MQQRAFAHSHTDNKNTPLHHPPVHPDDDTDAKQKITSIPHTSRSASQLFVSSSACQVDALCCFVVGQRGTGWWQLGRRWTSRLLSDVSSGKSAGAIAKRGWPSSSVRQRVAALKRRDPAPRYVGGVERRLTPALLDEIRKCIEEEHGRISVTTVSNRFTLCRTCGGKAILCRRLRPLEIRTPSGGLSHP